MRFDRHMEFFWDGRIDILLCQQSEMRFFWKGGLKQPPLWISTIKTWDYNAEHVPGVVFKQGTAHGWFLNMCDVESCVKSTSRLSSPCIKLESALSYVAIVGTCRDYLPSCGGWNLLQAAWCKASWRTCGKSFPPHAPSQRFWRIVLWWPGAIPRTGATAAQCVIAWDWAESTVFMIFSRLFRHVEATWSNIFGHDQVDAHFFFVSGWRGSQARKSVVHIHSTYGAFAAILEGGRVVTWGYPSDGGDSSDVVHQLHDVARRALLCCFVFACWTVKT